VGSSVGFLGTAKVISQWFDAKNYGRMLGITFSFGLLGAVYGGKPVANWIHLTHWESVLDSIACVGLGIGMLAMVFLRKSGPHESTRTQPQLADLWQVISDKKLILLGLCNLLMVGALEGFADVWGVPYLMKAYGIEKGTAALLTSTVFIGMLFGGPLLALIAEKTLGFLKTASFSGVLIALLMLTILFVLQDYSSSILMTLMFLLGILCCYQVLILTVGSRICPPALLGITTAFLNCINMLGGAFFHGSIGLLLDFTWDQGIENGIRVYSAESFKLALLIIPAASFLGALGLFVVQKWLSKQILVEAK
jgi:MFS family permease